MILHKKEQKTKLEKAPQKKDFFLKDGGKNLLENRFGCGVFD